MMRYEETHGHYPFMEGGKGKGDAASSGTEPAAAVEGSQDKC